ncbi:DNA polymerase III [Paenibacillus agilis]|uniref:DNA polymerase III n=1 Tax=Paenibacillus agilis TaxID=3020863 RepID=UPI003007DA26
MLYHAILPEDHEHYVPIHEVLKNGINHLTKSNYWYGNGGEVKLCLTNQLRPPGLPSWIDFKKAIGVDLKLHKPKSFSFPTFTDKVLVFDGDISLSIYDQVFYEDLKDTDEEALNFDTGESIEHWVKLYWNSMMVLDEYKAKKPYPRPEILVFESIPQEIIKVQED